MPSPNLQKRFIGSGIEILVLPLKKKTLLAETLSLKFAWQLKGIVSNTGFVTVSLQPFEPEITSRILYDPAAANV